MNIEFENGYKKEVKATGFRDVSGGIAPRLNVQGGVDGQQPTEITAVYTNSNGSVEGAVDFNYADALDITINGEKPTEYDYIEFITKDKEIPFNPLIKPAKTDSAGALTVYDKIDITDNCTYYLTDEDNQISNLEIFKGNYNFKVFPRKNDISLTIKYNDGKGIDQQAIHEQTINIHVNIPETPNP